MDDLGDSGQCFSCGFFGHGVNRCPRLDRSFPYKMPGWSVDVQDGQYRASRIRGDEHDLRRGKERWFRRESQPPGPSVTVTRLTHPESDGLVERFNRTLLMMLAMFAGEHRDDWDDLLPPVMMAYRSSAHEYGF